MTYSFISPRWGGFVIDSKVHNRTNATGIYDVNLKEAMEVFVAHLKLLLGIPKIVSSSFWLQFAKMR